MNTLEVAGVVTGIAGIILTLKEKVWCFPVGLINVIISMTLFWQQKLYADTLQQLVYIILLIYGWYAWVSHTEQKQISVSRSNFQLLFIVLICCCLCTFILGSLLKNYTDASMPWTDSAATSVSFAAQWMIARKKIENWILWIAVNLTYTWIYFVKALPLYAGLYICYLVLAVWGYYQWRKQLLKTADV